MTLAPTTTLPELATWLATFGIALQYGPTKRDAWEMPAVYCNPCTHNAPAASNDTPASTRKKPGQPKREPWELSPHAIDPWEPADFQRWDGGAA